MKANAPDAIPIFFNGHGYQGFVNSAFFRCSPIGLINFDGTPQTLTTGTNHGSTQLVQQRPCRLIASDSKFPLQPQSTDPILLACEMPHCSEPECQREVAVLKNSARKDINLPPTRRTQQAVTASFPNAPASAGRTLDSLRPPKPEQILPARFVIGETLFQFQARSGHVDDDFGELAEGELGRIADVDGADNFV